MKRLALSTLLLCGLFAVFSAPHSAAAPVSFQQAVADYNAGKYGQANSEFEGYKQAYPNNAMVHYYLALCKQGLGQLESAKAEYTWVSQYGDARLKGMALAGIANLSKAHSSSSGSASVATTSTPHAPASAPVVATAKVKKIIEFYADW